MTDISARTRKESEITPIKAVHSKTLNRNEKFAAAKSIDLNLNTECRSDQGQDGKTWLEISLGEVYCVEKVLWLWQTGSDRFIWTCSENGCDECSGSGADRCGELRVIVTMATISNTASSPPSRCKLGDAVRVERVDYSHYNGIWAPEIVVIGLKGRSNVC